MTKNMYIVYKKNFTIKFNSSMVYKKSVVDQSMFKNKKLRWPRIREFEAEYRICRRKDERRQINKKM